MPFSITTSRQIKFRAWQDNQMLSSPIGTNYGLNRFFGMLYEDAPIMQFTGLKDSNDVDIYEGDIVNLYPLEGGIIWHRRIVWDTGAFFCVAIHTDANHPLHFSKYKTMKDNPWVVIGNIYENPDLLKKI